MDVKQELKDFFKNNFMMEVDGDFSDDDSFLDKGIIDSTGVLELIMFLESNYHIKIADEEIVPENLDSFNKLNDFISKKIVT